MMNEDFKDIILQVAATYNATYVLTNEFKILYSGKSTKYDNVYNLIEYDYSENVNKKLLIFLIIYIYKKKMP